MATNPIRTSQQEMDDIAASERHPKEDAPRARALDRAKELTLGARNVDYGDPVANHWHIARIFNAITGHNLTARDIAIVHQATKMARRQNTPDHYDSYVDGMAYTGIELECALSESIKGQPEEKSE